MRAPGMCPCGTQFKHYGTFATAALAREEARLRMIELLKDNPLPFREEGDDEDEDELEARFTANFEIDGTGYFFAPNGMRDDGHGSPSRPIRVKMVVTRKMAAAGGEAAGEDA